MQSQQAQELQEIILFCVQIISLVALIVYVIKTWEMAAATRRAAEATAKSVVEMRETRDQETAPYVIVYFQIEVNQIYLVVKNIGRTIAAQVKLTFTPELQCSGQRDLREVGFLKHGIESMPPNYEIRTWIDSAPQYFAKELPLTYDVEIGYFGGIEPKRRTSRQQLDLSAHKGTSYLLPPETTNSRLSEIVREIQRMGNSLERISSTLEEGILISNSSFLITRVEPGSWNWEKYVVAKLNEFESLWTVHYRDQREHGLRPSRLQARAQLIGEQLALITANRVTSAPANVLETLTSIVCKLRELGQKQFYIDGGVSLGEFNSLGDSIIEDIASFRRSLLIVGSRETA